MSLPASWEGTQGPSQQSQALLPSKRPKCEFPSAVNLSPRRGRSPGLGLRLFLAFFPRKVPRLWSSPGRELRSVSWPAFASGHLADLQTVTPWKGNVREGGTAQGSPAVPGSPSLLPNLGGHRASDPPFSHFAISVGRTLGVGCPIMLARSARLSCIPWKDLFES